jgi:hypothetical protein
LNLRYDLQTFGAVLDDLLHQMTEAWRSFKLVNC